MSGTEAQGRGAEADVELLQGVAGQQAVLASHRLEGGFHVIDQHNKGRFQRSNHSKIVRQYGNIVWVASKWFSKFLLLQDSRQRHDLF